jgi:uncharacterized protein (DUF885 family)
VGGDAQEQGRALAEWFWEGLLEAEPLLGTQVGDERYDDRLPDASDEGRERNRRFFQQALDDLAGIDRASLDQDVRATLDVLEAVARNQLDAIDHRLDHFHSVSHFTGPGTLVAELASLQRADTPERLDMYAARLRAIPTFLDQLAGSARDGAATGQVAPGLVVDRIIGQLERLLALDPVTSPGVAPVAEASDEERQRVQDVLRDQVWPAYARYLEAVREYRPSARDSIGLSALEGGDAIYASLVRTFTTLPLDPKDVHEIGVRELAGIQEERREIAKRLGHPDAASAVRAHAESGRNTAASREEMVKLAEDQVQRSWESAPGYFGRLPRQNCEVKAVEEFREKDMADAFYYPPSMDGSRLGIYYVNTSDLEKRPLHHLASITYHEANPGHHFQVSIEQEFSDRLPLRRFGGILAGSAFIEGWGLYSERLADEMGLYLDDYERLGMLEAQGWRACRLIVDSGIHALGWDRERSIAQMEEAGVPRVSAEIETDRYIAWPGQALAYMVGQLEIQRIRKDAEGRDGSAFSLRDFHDRLLGIGSVPLEGLRREMANGARS